MTDTPILKEQALAAFGNNGSELARALGIKPSAVYQWPDGKPIPEKQALRLRYELRPELFGADADKPSARRPSAAAGASAEATQPVLTGAAGADGKRAA